MDADTLLTEYEPERQCLYEAPRWLFSSVKIVLTPLARFEKLALHTEH